METQVRAFIHRLKAQKRYSNNTVLAYASDVQHFTIFLENTLGRLAEITDLNPQQFEAFFEAERQMNKTSTLRRRYAALKRFTQFLNQTGNTKSLELPEIGKIIRLDSGQVKVAVCLNETQIETLWATIQADTRPQAKRDAAILSVILEFGLPTSRLAALDLSDFDVIKNQLQLHKSTGNTLWVPLPHNNENLKTYLLEGRPELNPLPNENALFISQLGTRVSRQGIWQICRRWGKRAKLPGGLSPRKLRYTAVQRMILAGYSEKYIHAILDHLTPVATQALLERIPIP